MHGGFGLRTVGELRKPRWWALAMLERLGTRRLPVGYDGDGAGSLVEAVAATEGDTRTVALWNLTLDQSKATGDAALDREVTVELTGLEPGTSYSLTHERVDEQHSNIARVWGGLREDGQAWPTDEQWETLRAADRLEQLEPTSTVTADDAGVVQVTTTMPMPSMSLLTLAP